MPDPYQPIPQNAPLQISARTFNGLLKAGQDFSRRRFGETGSDAGQGLPLIPACKVLILNSGAALPEFSVLGFGGMPLPPTDRPLDVADQPLFLATLPLASGPVCITTEPIPAGAIGEAVLTGAAVVQIDFANAGDGYALPIAGDSTKLASVASGGIPILWKDAGTGLKWALVSLTAAGNQSLLDFNQVGQVKIDGDTTWTVAISPEGIPYPSIGLWFAQLQFFNNAGTAAVVNSGFAIWDQNFGGPADDPNAIAFPLHTEVVFTGTAGLVVTLIAVQHVNYRAEFPTSNYAITPIYKYTPSDAGLVPTILNMFFIPLNPF